MTTPSPVDTSSFTPAQLQAFNSANALGSGVQTTNSSATQPAGQAPVTPTPQMPTPAVPSPTVNVNVGQQPAAQPTQQQSQTSQQSAPPQTNLQQGAQGQDVQQLQNYLVQMGYLTPQQVATGAGTYGPQTTAAVAKMQQDLGIQAGTAAGSYGPQTQAALAQKYQGIYDQVKGAQAPTDGGAARNAIASADMASSAAQDPVYGSMAASLAPIMQSLGQVLQNINNPALGAVSLQQEYNDLASQNNLPAMQAQMMNMQNVMNGTESDIREEITKVGGFATESQVQGLAAARNKVIMKQYNAVATQYTAAKTTVDNMMQFAQQDQSNNLQRQQMTASITQNMASISAQMMQMGMTMQQHATDNANKIVTNIGYSGLAAQAGGNPSVLKSYEQLLGLAPGALSDPKALQQMDTIRQQQLALGQQKVNIQMYTAGMGTGGTTSPIGLNNTGGTTAVVDPSTLNRPSWLPNSVPLSMSASEMTQYTDANKAAKVDGNTNNIIAPGVGYYIHQPDGSYVLNSALPSTVDTQYSQIRSTMDNAGVFNGSPTVTRKWTLSANSAISSFKDTGTYKVASNVAPYLAAIHAAAVNPGDKSISDFELLDSFVKAAKGGTGQVTDAQIDTMIRGSSLNDTYAKLQQKLENGGVLAPAQRASLVQLADETYKRNLLDYQKGYVQAVQAMQGQGIPPQFWRNLPDFTSLIPVE